MKRIRYCVEILISWLLSIPKPKLEDVSNHIVFERDSPVLSYYAENKHSRLKTRYESGLDLNGIYVT